MCNSNGEWEDVDFTNCTMDLDATPFIAVEVQQALSNMTVSTDVLGTVSNQVRISNIFPSITLTSLNACTFKQYLKLKPLMLKLCSKIKIILKNWVFY